MSQIGSDVKISEEKEEEKEEKEGKDGKDGKDIPQLWPAWVYCTRYSDRPSSGRKFRSFFRN